MWRFHREIYSSFQGNVMQVPNVLFGPLREVRKRCSPIVRSVVEGSSLGQALQNIPMADTYQAPGLLLISDPGQPLRSQNHFHLYPLHQMLFVSIGAGQIDRNRERQIFEESLASPWSTLSLLSMIVGAGWSNRHPEWCWDVLGAAQQFLDEFTKVGPRFSSDLVTDGHLLWQVPCMIGPVLAYCGVSEDLLRERLRNEGIRSLIPYLRPRPPQQELSRPASDE